MTVGHVLLGLLEQGGRHGYDLKREYDLRFPAARPMAPAQVYAALDRLERGGLVLAGAVQRVAGPDRTTFVITDPGRSEFHRWLTAVEPPPDFVANPLAVRITLALLTMDRETAVDLLRRQREAHLQRMRELTRTKTVPDAPLAEVLAADHTINHLDADLRWIDTALARVDRLHEELTRP